MSSAYPWLVVAPVAGLATYCLVHIGIARRTADRSPYFALAAAMFVGLALVAGLSLAALLKMGVAAGDVCALAAMNLLCYLALAFGYFNFVNLNITALRIRMLHEVAASRQGMSRRDLLSRYNAGEVIGLRIERLVRGGHIVERDGRFFSGKARFLCVAAVFEFLRWLILGRRRPANAGGPKN